MFLKNKIKKKFKNLNYCDYKFLKKFINMEGKIFFKNKYKKMNFWIKNKIKKYVKRFRFLSLLPYTFKHIFNNGIKFKTIKC
ncbi:30S ribosomal protein S18 [Candidatus Nasuia deltocephalinicola]|uniref:30S ribosomal protein S18 n=1 Tax=Candidatus Nasuia deltocephalincola TaxID=1160784 RepID=UPI00216B5CD7|nr:30S ribosomal protein S18 [Candidatus Nasuia deltocephalinicola]